MKKIRFSQNWAFTLNGTPMGQINLPHDFSISQARSADALAGADGGYFPGGYGVYEKTFSPEPNKKYFFLCDGAFGMTEVILNENFAAINRYGYNGFYAELTDFLRYDKENRLTVRVNNKWQPNARWYTGSGLYRDVWLCESPASYIVPYGLFFTASEIFDGDARMLAEIRFHAERKGEGELLCEILEEDSDVPVYTFRRSLWAEHGDNRYETKFEIRNAKIWDIDTPNLYRAKVTLTLNGISDSDETVFGVRTVYADREKGFYLNSREIKIRGGCIHHDHGPIGAASYADAEYRRVTKLKAAGFNTIRTTHNPQSSAFYEVCDRLGMLVIDELYDYWNDGKRADDFHYFFEDHYLSDLDLIVRRDRNHPSVIMWSTGNEIPEKGGLSNGYRIASELSSAVRALDPTRPVTHALCGFWDKQEWAEKENATYHYGADEMDFWADRTKITADTLDVVGCNYMEDRAERDLIRFPDRLILITESFPIRSYDTVKRVDRTRRMLGDCVWTAWDYFGETSIGHVKYDGTTPHGLLSYPNHISDCGDFDICGFRKPQSYYREIAFGKRTDPYITVRTPARFDQPYKISGWGFYDGIPSWCWTEYEGAPIEVYVFGEADEMILECNGSEVGRMSRTADAVYLFKTVYHSGTLTAKAVNDGKVTGEWSLTTEEAPAKLSLTAEPSYAPANTVSEDGKLLYVEADVLDQNGNLCTQADNDIRFEVSGATLLAVGSGKVDSEEEYTTDHRRAYLGRMLAVLLRDPDGRKVTVRAVSDGVEAAELTIE